MCHFSSLQSKCDNLLPHPTQGCCEDELHILNENTDNYEVFLKL